MPIRRLLDSNAFNPEEVTILRDVFEDTLCALKLTDRSDPVTSLIAKKIIELARLGERDLTFASSGPAGMSTCSESSRSLRSKNGAGRTRRHEGTSARLHPSFHHSMRIWSASFELGRRPRRTHFGVASSCLGWEGATYSRSLFCVR